MSKGYKAAAQKQTAGRQLTWPLLSNHLKLGGLAGRCSRAPKGVAVLFISWYPLTVPPVRHAKVAVMTNEHLLSLHSVALCCTILFLLFLLPPSPTAGEGAAIQCLALQKKRSRLVSSLLFPQFLGLCSFISTLSVLGGLGWGGRGLKDCL